MQLTLINTGAFKHYTNQNIHLNNDFFLPYTVNPPKVGNSWSVLLQLVPNTCSASRIMHARLNLLFLKKAFTWNMKTTRIYKFFFVVVLNDWGTVTNNMSRMHQWLQRKYPAYVSLQQKRRKDSRASKESVHWHQSDTVTVQAPLRFNEMGQLVWFQTVSAD